jgi:iron complex transport system ATP-binding protein
VELIRVQDLSFSFGGAAGTLSKAAAPPVLRGITLSSEDSGIVVLLGPNGSGKTTLLRCINGMLTPQRGSISVNGRPLHEYSRRELARIMSVVPQVHRPSFPYTVLDVVLIGRTPHVDAFAMPGKHDVAVAKQCLEAVGISRLAQRVYTRVSGGEMRLVLIARALAQEPRVLLLDEPTAHLDVANQLRVLGTVRKLTKEVEKDGMSTLISLHDPNHALAFADKVALLFNGELVASGKPEDVITVENMKKVYGVDADIITHKGKRFVVFVSDDGKSNCDLSGKESLQEVVAKPL